MRNRFNFSISKFLRGRGAGIASVPICRAFHLDSLGAKAAFAVSVGVYCYSTKN
jgi:hypothetical protein